MPVFLEEKFLILEHKVTFGFVSYPSSVLIYKNRPQGYPPLTAQLSCQWSVVQQRDSRPATNEHEIKGNFSGTSRSLSKGNGCRPDRDIDMNLKHYMESWHMCYC